MFNLFKRKNISKSISSNTSNYNKIENILVTLGLLDILQKYKTAFSTYESRDLYLNLKESFNDFEQLYKSQSLDIHFLNPILNDFSSIGENLNNESNELRFPNFEILRIDPANLDSKSLKKAFRKASLEHHPDRGGEEWKMKKAIDEYVHIEKYLLTNKLMNKTDGDSIFNHDNQASNVEGFYKYTRLEVYKASVDIWDLKYSIELFNEILNSEYQIFTGHLLYNQICFIDWDFKFYRRLDLIDSENYNDYLERYIDYIKSFEGRNYINDGIIHSHTAEETLRNHLEFLENYKSILDNKLRKIYNHPLQLSFALDNKIIDDKYYKAKSKNFGELEAKEIALVQKVINFFSNPGFFVFDYELNFEESEDDCGNDYAFLYKELTKSKRKDYIEAFYKNPSINLIRKYLHVRLNSIIENLLILGKFENKERLLRELELLASLKREKSLKLIFEEIIELIKIIREGDLAIEQKKLLLKISHYNKIYKNPSIDLLVSPPYLSYYGLILY